MKGLPSKKASLFCSRIASIPAISIACKSPRTFADVKPGFCASSSICARARFAHATGNGSPHLPVLRVADHDCCTKPPAAVCLPDQDKTSAMPDKGAPCPHTMVPTT
jgi:hypothetical protein